jgi:membrane-bound inhibitor of C-type lysozyme
MKRVLLSFAVASVALGGLVASTPAEAKKAITAKYYCNKGLTLKVVFQGNKAVVTPKGGKTVTLPQGMSADGFYYVKGKYSLRGRGDDATWSAGFSKPYSCTAR